MGTTVFAQVNTPGPPGPAGPAGYAPVYIVAAGAPSNAIGNDHDMYIDSTNGNVYGPKVSGSWGAIVCNIKGSTGATGSQGPPGYSPVYIVAAGAPGAGVGNNGDMYINSTTSDVYGPKTAGTWGGIQCNIKGVQGPPGVAYTPKGAWAAGTTYAQGDQVTSGNQLYISLQSPNLGHDPATSPTFWQAEGTGGTPQTPWLSDIDAAGFRLITVAASNKDLIFAPNSTERVRITAGGNVGFGVANPPYALDIATAGDVQIRCGTWAGVSGDASGGFMCGENIYRDTAGAFRALTTHSTLGGGGMLVASGVIRFLNYTTAATQGATVSAIERMRIDTAGNVGIGSISPVALIHGIKVGNNDPSVAYGSAAAYILNTAGVELAMGCSSIPPYPFWMQSRINSSTAQPLVLNPLGGNVGIGTGTPQMNLDVAGSIRAAGAQAGTPSSGAGVESGYYSNHGYVMAWDRSVGVSKSLTLNESGGNVGIGTTVPSFPLDIVGSNVTQMRITQNTPNTGILYFQAGSVGNPTVMQLWMENSSVARGCAIGTGAPGAASAPDLVFAMYNGVAWGEKMRLTQAGFLGVGKTPSYALDVVGVVNCSNVFEVNGNPCPRINFYTEPTASKALGTSYQNTSGVPTFVAVTVVINAGCYAQLQTDLNNPPSNPVCARTNAFGAPTTITETVNGWVMPNQWYRVFTTGATLSRWFEWS